MVYHVIIPEWEYYFVKAKKTSPKYWLFKDKEKLPKKYLAICSKEPTLVGGKLYCKDDLGNRFLKNPIKVGKENIWVLNGQDLYNASINYIMRGKIAQYYHSYFAKYINEQLEPLSINEDQYISNSVDIYEIYRGKMPDISNMWLLEKFFEDALIEEKIIPNDSPEYVLESGRKKYHWVTDSKDRKLVFNIEILEKEKV